MEYTMYEPFTAYFMLPQELQMEKWSPLSKEIQKWQITLCLFAFVVQISM